MTASGLVITLSAREYNGMLCDYDVVLTKTASVHAAACKQPRSTDLTRTHH
jgi:hypothetical protein